MDIFSQYLLQGRTQLVFISVWEISHDTRTTNDTTHLDSLT